MIALLEFNIQIYTYIYIYIYICVYLSIYLFVLLAQTVPLFAAKRVALQQQQDRGA